MDWSKLARERCPRCGERLHEPTGFLDSHRHCSGSHCLFKIDIDKFNKIVSDEKRREAKEYNPDENLSALNNL